MAEIVEDHNWNAPGRRREAYPWDDWTNGKIWKITQGEDFEVRMSSMQSQLRNRYRYKAQGFKVRINMFDTPDNDPPYIIFQYWRKEETDG